MISLEIQNIVKDLTKFNNFSVYDNKLLALLPKRDQTWIVGLKTVKLSNISQEKQRYKKSPKEYKFV